MQQGPPQPPQGMVQLSVRMPQYPMGPGHPGTVSGNVGAVHAMAAQQQGPRRVFTPGPPPPGQISMMSAQVAPSTMHPSMPVVAMPAPLPGHPLMANSNMSRKRKLGDRVIPASIRKEFPDSESYMKMMELEKNLDRIIMHKKLSLQEALKKPYRTEQKLRILLTTNVVSNFSIPGMPPPPASTDPNSAGGCPGWELRMEGKLLDEHGQPLPLDSKNRKKFSTFFKSLYIVLDQNLYGPDNHVVEWHRGPNTQETDGFQVKRAGSKNVMCNIYFHLDHVPPKFKLDPRLARLLGIHTATRSRIIYALWTYIKTHRLQDENDRNTIRCDAYLEQIFGMPTLRFNELPTRILSLQQAPDPIHIRHTIRVEDLKPNQPGHTTAYDITVDVEDAYKMMSHMFLQNMQTNGEVQAIDEKIYELVDQLMQVKTSRQFYAEFAEDPREFITRWAMSQSQDLKSITETGDTQCPSEVERRAEFYAQPWTQEGVMRYLHNKLNQRRLELEQLLGLNN